MRLTVSTTALRSASVKVGCCWPQAAANHNASKPGEKRMTTSGQPQRARKEKSRLRGCLPLRRYRDLLPSRHGRAARHRASGFMASELRFNMRPRGSVARAGEPASRDERAASACPGKSTHSEPAFPSSTAPDARTGGLGVAGLWAALVAEM